MPLDDTLPSSRLPARLVIEQIVSHFPAGYGVRVDLAGLQSLPANVRSSLRRARLPEPPEAVLLDRVLQLLPPHTLAVVDRILISSGETRRRLATLGIDWR